MTSLDSAAALVLNASYEPLCVVPSRRAVVLVLTGKGIAVADGDGVLHSSRAAVVVPAVVRLTRFVKVPFRATAPAGLGPAMNGDRRTNDGRGRGDHPGRRAWRHRRAIYIARRLIYHWRSVSATRGFINHRRGLADRRGRAHDHMRHEWQSDA